jgi:putative inorganic carbon (HCO3(-)) transporter
VLVLSVVSGTPLKLGVILLALLAGAVLILQDDRWRAGAMLAALILAPLLLLGDIWSSPQLDVVRRHPLVAVAAALIGLLALIAVAALLARHRPWIAPLALGALPFRVPISVSGSTYNLLVPLYFVIAASALSWLVPVLAHRERAGRRRRAHSFEWLLALSVVLYAIQAWYSARFGTLDGFAAALRNLTFFYVPFAMLAALLRDLDWNETLLRRCLIVLGGLALIFSAVGFWEEATGTVLLNPKLIAANQVHPYFTVNSVFFDPDIFGRFLAIVMILTAAVLIYRRRSGEVITSAVVLAILWGCLVLTLSRSSLGALLVGLAVLAAFRWNATRLVLGALAAALLIGGLALAITPSTFGLNQGLNGASSGRASLISGGARMFADRPLTGYGSGSFEAEYAKRHGGSCGTVCASHTIAVTIAAEQGLIGLIPYLALLASAIITLFRGARGDPARVAIAAALLALLFHTELYADFLEDPTTWVLLAIGGALAHRWADGRESERRAARQARRRLAATT